LLIASLFINLLSLVFSIFSLFFPFHSINQKLITPHYCLLVFNCVDSLGFQHNFQVPAKLRDPVRQSKDGNKMDRRKVLFRERPYLAGLSVVRLWTPESRLLLNDPDLLQWIEWDHDPTPMESPLSKNFPRRRANPKPDTSEISFTTLSLDSKRLVEIQLDSDSIYPLFSSDEWICLRPYYSASEHDPSTVSSFTTLLYVMTHGDHEYLLISAGEKYVVDIPADYTLISVNIRGHQEYILASQVQREDLTFNAPLPGGWREDLVPHKSDGDFVNFSRAKGISTVHSPFHEIVTKPSPKDGLHSTLPSAFIHAIFERTPDYQDPIVNITPYYEDLYKMTRELQLQSSQKRDLDLKLIQADSQEHQETQESQLLKKQKTNPVENDQRVGNDPSD
jgi:hypothetical protein